MIDQREEAFGPRAVALCPGWCAGHRNEVLDAGKEKGVVGAVLRNPARGGTCDGRDRDLPAEAERSVAAARPVPQRQLRAEVAAPSRNVDWNRCVAGAGVEIGCEALPEPVLRPTSLRERNDLLGGLGQLTTPRARCRRRALGPVLGR